MEFAIALDGFIRFEQTIQFFDGPQLTGKKLKSDKNILFSTEPGVRSIPRFLSAHLE